MYQRNIPEVSLPLSCPPRLVLLKLWDSCESLGQFKLPAFRYYHQKYWAIRVKKELQNFFSIWEVYKKPWFLKTTIFKQYQHQFVMDNCSESMVRGGPVFYKFLKHHAFSSCLQQGTVLLLKKTQKNLKQYRLDLDTKCSIEHLESNRDFKDSTILFLSMWGKCDSNREVKCLAYDHPMKSWGGGLETSVLECSFLPHKKIEQNPIKMNGKYNYIDN